MMSNPNHFRHYPRQPNVVIMITDSKGEILNVYHKLVTMDLFISGGVTILEVREFQSVDAAEPVNITFMVNPVKLVLLAKPDPERLNQQ